MFLIYRFNNNKTKFRKLYCWNDLRPHQNPVSDAIVYAWSDDGREAYVETNANGEYSLLVPNGAVWHVGAEYAEIDENGSEAYFSTEYEVDVDLKSATSSSGQPCP